MQKQKQPPILLEAAFSSFSIGLFLPDYLRVNQDNLHERCPFIYTVLYCSIVKDLSPCYFCVLFPLTSTAILSTT